MRSNEFVTTEEVVAEAVEYLNDTDFMHGIGRSFYELMAHRCIEELALDTFFDVKTTDIFCWNACGEGIIPIPKNCFNIKDMFLFNSSCDKDREHLTEPLIQTSGSCCGDSNDHERGKHHWEKFINVKYAVNYNKFGSSGLATKRRTELYREFIHGWDGYERHRHLAYFGIQNGMICVSDTGRHWKNMRLICNTFGTDNCELPIIPRELRTACVDYIKVKACMKLMVLFPEYKQMYAVYKSDLYGDGSFMNPGSWLKATRFIVSLNSKARKDLQEYFGNIHTK